MSRILLLINFILLIAFVGLAMAVWKFKRAPQDEILRWKPRISDISGQGSAINQNQTQLGVIRSKNIFSPTRGSGSAAESGNNGPISAPPKFELVGTCSIGDQSGAIIEVKNTADLQNSNKKNRRYYAVGDEVYGDFKLETVNDSSIILKRKEETLEIKIDGSRFSAEVGKNKAATPPSPQPPGTPVLNSPPPQRPSLPNTPDARPVRNIQPRL